MVFLYFTSSPPVRLDVRSRCCALEDHSSGEFKELGISNILKICYGDREGLKAEGISSRSY